MLAKLIIDAPLRWKKMKVNKQDLLSQLNNAQNNFIFGIAALGLLVQEESLPVLEKRVCVMTETSFSFVSDVSQIREQFKDAQFPVNVFPLSTAANYIKVAGEEQMQGLQREFFSMLLRNLLKESFESIKNYCEGSNQFSLFQQQDWYQFARMTRNCLSHDFSVDYKKDKRILKLLPINWNGRSFTLDMDGKPLNTSFIGINFALKLYEEMKAFVENLL